MRLCLPPAAPSKIVWSDEAAEKKVGVLKNYPPVAFFLVSNFDIANLGWVSCLIELKIP